MKLLTRLLGLAIVIVATATAVWVFMPSLRVAAICAPAEARAINYGLIKVEDADWGYLKLRSGRFGLEALHYLEREGRTARIAQVSVAVQENWFEAGHRFDCPGPVCEVPPPLEHETRFNELHMPFDGKTLRQDLSSSQRIPESFWRSQRFRIGCVLPPSSYANAKGDCSLQMADLNGDGQPEIFVIAHKVGTYGEYLKPVVRYQVEVYQNDGQAWTLASAVHPCPVNVDNAGDGRFRVLRQKLDMLWVNGHAVNFFNDDCFDEVRTENPAAALEKVRTMPVTRIGLLPGSKPIPASLAAALSSRSIVLSPTGVPPSQTWPRKPEFDSPPPCFTANDPHACMAMVADIDHDGNDDVVILGREVTEAPVDTYRYATLLMVRNGRWTVVANHAACAATSEKLETLQVTFKPATWRPIEFAERLSLPEELSDSCTQHYPLL